MTRIRVLTARLKNNTDTRVPFATCVAPIRVPFTTCVAPTRVCQRNTYRIKLLYI